MNRTWPPLSARRSKSGTDVGGEKGWLSQRRGAFGLGPPPSPVARAGFPCSKGPAQECSSKSQRDPRAHHTMNQKQSSTSLGSCHCKGFHTALYKYPASKFVFPLAPPSPPFTHENAQGLLSDVALYFVRRRRGKKHTIVVPFEY